MYNTKIIQYCISLVFCIVQPWGVGDGEEGVGRAVRADGFDALVSGVQRARRDAAAEAARDHAGIVAKNLATILLCC